MQARTRARALPRAWLAAPTDAAPLERLGQAVQLQRALVRDQRVSLPQRNSGHDHVLVADGGEMPEPMQTTAEAHTSPGRGMIAQRAAISSPPSDGRRPGALLPRLNEHEPVATCHQQNTDYPVPRISSTSRVFWRTVASQAATSGSGSSVKARRPCRTAQHWLYTQARCVATTTGRHSLLPGRASPRQADRYSVTPRGPQCRDRDRMYLRVHSAPLSDRGVAQDRPDGYRLRALTPAARRKA